MAIQILITWEGKFSFLAFAVSDEESTVLISLR